MAHIHCILEIRAQVHLKKKHDLVVSCFQTLKNRDVVDSLLYTIGYGRLRYIAGQDEREGKRKPGVRAEFNFAKTGDPSVRENYLDVFPPLLAGKRRDYLIAKVLLDHRLNKYVWFSDLNHRGVLNRRKISISPQDIEDLSYEEKRKVTTIACYYLCANTSPCINCNVADRRKKRKELKEDIQSLGLDPLKSTESMGINLGKYLLLGINQQVKDLDRKMLTDKTYFLPDDYLTGLYIGDGSLEFRLRFDETSPSPVFGYRFSMTLSRDSRATLKPLERKFGGKSQDRGGNVQYGLDARDSIRYNVIPSLDKHDMPYSKQRQVNIMKEIFVLVVDKKQYKSQQDLFRIIELWDELRSLHKVPAKITKAEMQQQALDYLRRNNLL